MQINNPYTEKIHEAIRRGDKQAEEKYRALSNEHIGAVIKDLESKMSKMQQKYNEVRSYPTKKEQLQRARELNRIGRIFVQKTIELKRAIRGK